MPFALGHFLPRPILRLHARLVVIKLRHQPGKAIQIVEQATFRVFVGVIENANRAAVAAGADLTQHLHILRADTERQDLPPLRIAADVHAIQVEAEQMRQHQRQHLVEPVQMTMAMMQVVNQANVLDALRLERFDNRDCVLWLAIPRAVIVERHLATQRSRRFADGLQTFDLFRDARRLIRCVLHLDGTAIAIDPELRLHAVLLEQLQRLLRFVIQ